MHVVRGEVMIRAHLLISGLAGIAFTGLAVGNGSTGASAQKASQASAQPFSGHVELPGVRLWYTDTGGNGIPMVLLHANTGNVDSWQYNIPGFVQAGYRVIAFDRRGWGRSIAVPETGPQPGTIAEDFNAL